VRRLRFPRTAVPVAVIAALVTAAAAGCSSGGGTAGHPGDGGSTPGGPGASTAAAPPTGVQLGQFLKHLQLPAGWIHARGTGGGETDSGGTVDPGTGPQRSQDNCSTLDSSAQASTFIRWWSESNASMIVTYPRDPQSLPEVTLSLGVFQPGDAAKAMAKLSALAADCRSFLDKYAPHDRTTVSASVVSHLGDQNVYLTSIDYSKDGKITDQVLLARSGNAMAGVDTNDAGGGAVRAATVQGFAGWLLGLLPRLPSGSSFVAGSQNPGAPPSVAPPTG
jgi:hypothetical protein